MLKDPFEKDRIDDVYVEMSVVNDWSDDVMSEDFCLLGRRNDVFAKLLLKRMTALRKC